MTKVDPTDELTPVQEIEAAITLLRVARNFLRSSGARRAGDAVARALKSAEGARRHAENKELSKVVCELAWAEAIRRMEAGDATNP
ncbi:MAG: hypothetical protein ACRC67_16560 [Inquilinus sp.]|uniref:hypothetical protein n=1 Tax=Inquilinus sp. TaxID=1932117 RepID=UPI003F2B706D